MEKREERLKIGRNAGEECTLSAACVGAIPTARQDMDWIQVRNLAEETGLLCVTGIWSDLWAYCSVLISAYVGSSLVRV
jgi:hypothetical protein